MSPTTLTGDNYGVEVAKNYGVIEAHFHAERDDQRECFRSLRQTDPRSDKKRIEETRGGLHSASCAWILEQSDFVRWRHDAERRMLWIKGDPGKGKTMLLCSIIDELEKDAEKGQRPCYFFCQATDARPNTAMTVLRGLLYLLAEQDPSLLDKYILERYRRAGSILFTEKNAWTTLSTVFAEMMSDSRLDGKIFIIDWLDECEVDRAVLLRFIVNAARSTGTKWLVSSRNRSDIESELGKIGPEVGLSLELTENAERIADAVGDYVDHSTSTLSAVQNNEALLIRIRDTVRRNAQGTFLWAALVIEELQDAEPWDVEEILDDRPPGLEKLYDRMFEQIQGLPKGNPENCRKVLASLLVAYQPLQLAELRVLSDLPPKVLADDYIRRLVGQCASFLTIRNHIVYFVHQSAKEFLLGKKPDAILPEGPPSQYRFLFSSSVDILCKALRRDIYVLRHPGTSVEDVHPPQPDPLAHAQYSCEFWADHLGDVQQSGVGNHGPVVLGFLKDRFLYWLEALSLISKIPEGVRTVKKL